MMNAIPAGVVRTRVCSGVDLRDANPPTKSATPHTNAEMSARRAATQVSQHIVACSAHGAAPSNYVNAESREGVTATETNFVDARDDG
jgi:hypothetical protein